MYLDGLDQLDQKILELLIENARISYSEIGETVGISRVAAKARVRALESRGIIEEYTTVVNPQKLNGAISCFLDIETAPDHLPAVEEFLLNEDMVTQIYRVTGHCRLHVHAVAASHQELEEFLRTKLDTLEGITRLDCGVILSRIKDVKGLRL